MQPARIEIFVLRELSGKLIYAYRFDIIDGTICFAFKFRFAATL